jgi:hypothetical protein
MQHHIYHRFWAFKVEKKTKFRKFYITTILLDPNSKSSSQKFTLLPQCLNTKEKYSNLKTYHFNFRYTVRKITRTKNLYDVMYFHCLQCKLETYDAVMKYLKWINFLTDFSLCRSPFMWIFFFFFILFFHVVLPILHFPTLDRLPQ